MPDQLFPPAALHLTQCRRLILKQPATSASSLLKALAAIAILALRLLRAAPTYGNDRNECCRYHDHTPCVHNRYSSNEHSAAVAYQASVIT